MKLKILFICLLCSLLGFAQIPCKDCRIVVTKENDKANFTVNAGEQICIEQDVEYFGVITLNGGMVCNRGYIYNAPIVNGGQFYNSNIVKFQTWSINNSQNFTFVNQQGSRLNIGALTINSVSTGIVTKFDIKVDSRFDVKGDLICSEGSFELITQKMEPKQQLTTNVNIGNFISSGNANITINNQDRATINVFKNLTLDGKGNKTIDNYGSINIFSDFNLLGKTTNSTAIGINNYETGNLYIRSNLSNTISKGVVTFVNKGDRAKIIIENTFTQLSSVTNVINNATFSVGKNFYLYKGTFTNSGRLTSAYYDVKNATLTSEQAIYADGNLKISAGGVLKQKENRELEKGNVIEVRNDFINEGTLELEQRTALYTNNFRNDNNGTIQGPDLNNDAFDYAYIQVINNSYNRGFIQGKIKFYDATNTGTNSFGIDDIGNSANRIQASLQPILLCPPKGKPLKIHSPVGPQVCSGASPFYLTASAGTGLSDYEYTWTSQIGGVITTTYGNTIQVIPTNTLTTPVFYSYTVTVNYFPNCSAPPKTFTLTVNPLPTANAGTDQFISNSSSIVIGGTPSATGGTPSYTYLWTPSTFLDNPSLANPTSTPSNNITYSLNVVDSKGCASVDQVTVFVLTPSYTILTADINAGYYTVTNNKVYFTIDGEYINSTIDYKILQLSNNQDVTTQVSLLPNLVNKLGDNRFTMNTSSLVNGNYMLVVINEKKEKKYLRFKK